MFIEEEAAEYSSETKVIVNKGSLSLYARRCYKQEGMTLPQHCTMYLPFPHPSLLFFLPTNKQLPIPNCRYSIYYPSISHPTTHPLQQNAISDPPTHPAIPSRSTTERRTIIHRRPSYQPALPISTSSKLCVQIQLATFLLQLYFPFPPLLFPPLLAFPHQHPHPPIPDSKFQDQRVRD
jgi:hypothetical protein